jgi:CBS domain-containing protein
VKRWVEEGRMELALPTRRIDPFKRAGPLRETKRGPVVRDIMQHKITSISQDEDIRTAARRLLRGETNHLPVIDASGKVVGIITTYDVSKAVVNPKEGLLVKDIMTRHVVVTTPKETVDIAAQKMEKNNISGLPVVNEEGKLIGLVSGTDLGKLFGGRWIK